MKVKVTSWVVGLALAGAGAGCALDDSTAGAPDTSSTQQQVIADVWHGTWNGGSAQASLWNGGDGSGNGDGTGGGGASGFIDVFENTSGQFRAAYLNFSAYANDPTSKECFDYIDPWLGETWHYCWFTRYTYAYGWGQIPASDADLTPGVARVRTTLPDDFGGARCTVDMVDWTYDCQPLGGGTIDVRWSRDGAYSTFHSGTDQQSYGPYTFKSQGTWWSVSAQASGSLLGTSYAHGVGQFGDTHQTTVSRSIFPTVH